MARYGDMHQSIPGTPEAIVLVQITSNNVLQIACINLELVQLLGVSHYFTHNIAQQRYLELQDQSLAHDAGRQLFP